MTNKERRDTQELRNRVGQAELAALHELFDRRSEYEKETTETNQQAVNEVENRLIELGAFSDKVDRAITLERQVDRPQPVLDELHSVEENAGYETPFLIDNWMPADRLTMLSGAGGVGKSYLALQHVVGLVLGIADYSLQQYHGDIEDKATITPSPFRHEPIKVIIASYEEDRRETSKRIERICNRLGWADYDRLLEGIKVVDMKKFGPLWGVKEDTHLAIRSRLLEPGEWLLDQCQSFGAKLLVIDPSAGAYGGNENARESVREYCSYLNGWGQEVGCATLLIAHPPKTESEYSGSTDWLGSCRAMWTLRVESKREGKGDEAVTRHWYQLTNVKQNYASPQRQIFLRKIKDTTHGEYTPVWEKCYESEALEFYEQYHDATVGGVDPKTPETPTDNQSTITTDNEDDDYVKFD